MPGALHQPSRSGDGDAEHDMFAEVMRDRGVEVFEAEELLAQALASPEARDWVCGHILNERERADAGLQLVPFRSRGGGVRLRCGQAHRSQPVA